MARAEAKMTTKTVTTTVPDGVTLYLNQDEAETLKFLTMRIAGSYTNSPRRHTDSIGRALSSAGIKRPNLATTNGTNNIHFTEVAK